MYQTASSTNEYDREHRSGWHCGRMCVKDRLSCHVQIQAQKVTYVLVAFIYYVTCWQNAMLQLMTWYEIEGLSVFL